MSSLARTPRQLGATIRQHRIKHGITQADLAARAGLRQATVSLIEGGHDAVRFRTIADLLAALDLELVVQPRSKGGPESLADIF